MTDTLTPPKRLNTAEIKALLRRRFDPGEYSIFWEVGDGRRADAVAINQWHSRGHAIHGFEIKASRSDWLRELKQPDKAEVVMGYCDHWWLVAAKGVVLNHAELPMGWGLLEPRGDTLYAQVKAPKLVAKPVDKRFMALCLRRAAADDEGMIDARVRALAEAARVEMDARIERRVEDRLRHLTGYQQKYEALAAALGGNEWSISPEDVKKAVAIVHASGVASTYHGLIGLSNQLTAAAKRIDAALAQLKETPDAPA